MFEQLKTFVELEVVRSFFTDIVECKSHFADAHSVYCQNAKHDLHTSWGFDADVVVPAVPTASAALWSNLLLSQHKASRSHWLTLQWRCTVFILTCLAHT